jgi:hypothetical protein
MLVNCGRSTIAIDGLHSYLNISFLDSTFAIHFVIPSGHWSYSATVRVNGRVRHGDVKIVARESNVHVTPAS